MKKRILFSVLAVCFLSILISCNGSPSEPPRDPNTILVTFVSNGGNSVSSQVVQKGEKVVKPANPIKNGTTKGGEFICWCTDEDCMKKYDFDTVPTYDITLYAKWRNWVQLWENGPKFAEYNVGSKVDFVQSTYKDDLETLGGFYTWGGQNNRTEYKYATYYHNDSPSYTRLPSTEDTATYLWGRNWRMPTKKDFDDMLVKCTCTWIENGGDKKDTHGLLVTGKGSYSENSIFLPAAGIVNATKTVYAGSSHATTYNTDRTAYNEGQYWTSIPAYPASLHNSYYFSFTSTNPGFYYSMSMPEENRATGRSIRPIYDPD